MQQNKTGFPLFLSLLVTYRMMVSTMPALGARLPAVINMSTLLLTYGLIFSYLGGVKIRSTVYLFFPLFLFVILDSLFGYSGVNSSVVVLSYGLLQDFMWPLLVACLVAKDFRSLGKYTLALLLICLIITSITTYIGNMEIPGASRALARLDKPDQMDLVREYKLMNIGGVDFIYQLVLMFPLLIYAIRQGSKKIRIVSIVAIVVFLMTILISEYTTALIFALSSSLLFLMPANASGKKLMTTTIGIIIVLLTAVYVFDIFGFMASTFEERTAVAERLQDISNHINGVSYAGGDYDSRLDKWTISLEAFFSSPIYGTGHEGGGHSYILDHLAQYGMIGMIILIIIFNRMFKLSVRKYEHSVLYSTLFFVFIAELGLTLLNPYIHLIIFTLVVPLFTYVFKPQLLNPQT